jgi:hypothetical protein
MSIVSPTQLGAMTRILLILRASTFATLMMPFGQFTLEFVHGAAIRAARFTQLFHGYGDSGVGVP